MYLDKRHQGKYYKVYEGQTGLVGGGANKKPKPLNTDERPFNKGRKDRAYVSPNFVSHMCFYGHSHEPVDNPHIQEKKHHLGQEGYNFNNYVVYDGNRTERSTVVPGKSQRTEKTQSYVPDN